MAFIFSTSHLPETRVRRPDHLEDEEEEDVMLPMPRAGGVRAFSHLPVRDNPAPSTAPLREDSPRREIAPIPPRSATPTSPAPTRLEDQDDPPPSEANPEDDTAPQDHADDSPWYRPRLTAQDLLPQDHPEDAHAPGLNGSASTTRDSGFSPSPQDLRDAFHAPTPDSPTREAPAQDSRPALLRGRIFEKRLPPSLRDQGTSQFQSLTDKPEYHDLVYRPGNAENERHQADGFLQNVADTRTTRQAPSSPKEPQTFAQSVRPAAQPAQKGGQTTAAAPPPSPGNVNATPPTFKVDPADESKKNFMLRTPETQEKHPSDRAFGDHARSIMQDELDKSPIARKLLEHITRMTGKPVIIQMLTDPRDTAHPVYRSDGSIAINPTDLRSGTLSHEITHVIQRWASEQALKWAKEQDPEIIKATPPGQEVKLMSKNTQAINSKAREILHSIMPVTYDAERNNGTQDYIENEAMRASHIVNAEISAVNLKAELEAMKNSPKQRDRDHYEWLIKHPANIAEKFWAHQLPMEQAVHATNQGRPIPKGTRYRDYDYVYAKVLDILNSPDTPKEQRVTADHLKWERFHKVKDN